MAIEFPPSPSLNQIATLGGSSWQWDGTLWNVFNSEKTWNLIETKIISGSPLELDFTDLPDNSDQLRIVVKGLYWSVGEVECLQLGYGDTPTFVVSDYDGQASNNNQYRLWRTDPVYGSGAMAGLDSSYGILSPTDTKTIIADLTRIQNDIWQVDSRMLSTGSANNYIGGIGWVDVANPLTAIKFRGDNTQNATMEGGTISLYAFANKALASNV